MQPVTEDTATGGWPEPEDGFWQEQGYLVGRRLDDRHWLCVHRMIFTWRVMVCDEISVFEFCCFEQLGDALACWAEWDGRTLPPGNWVRHHGGVGMTRRRDVAD